MMATDTEHLAYDGKPVERWCPSCGFPLKGCLAIGCVYCAAYPEVRGDYPSVAFLRAFPDSRLATDGPLDAPAPGPPPATQEGEQNP